MSIKDHDYFSFCHHLHKPCWKSTDYIIIQASSMVVSEILVMIITEVVTLL